MNSIESSSPSTLTRPKRQRRPSAKLAFLKGAVNSAPYFLQNYWSFFAAESASMQSLSSAIFALIACQLPRAAHSRKWEENCDRRKAEIADEKKTPRITGITEIPCKAEFPFLLSKNPLLETAIHARTFSVPISFIFVQCDLTTQISQSPRASQAKASPKDH